MSFQTFIADLIERMPEYTVQVHRDLDECATYVVREPGMLHDLTINYIADSNTLDFAYDEDVIYEGIPVAWDPDDYTVVLLMMLDRLATEF